MPFLVTDENPTISAILLLCMIHPIFQLKLGILQMLTRPAIFPRRKSPPIDSIVEQSCLILVTCYFTSTTRWNWSLARLTAMTAVKVMAEFQTMVIAAIESSILTYFMESTLFYRQFRVYVGLVKNYAFVGQNGVKPEKKPVIGSTSCKDLFSLHNLFAEEEYFKFVVSFKTTT